MKNQMLMWLWHRLMYALTCFLFLLTRTLPPWLRQSLFYSFLIVGLVCGFKILRSDTSFYKLSRKLSLALRRVSRGRWRLIEYRRVYYLIFPWVGLISHNVWYKVFLKESFSEYLCLVNFFVKKHCLPYSKIVWSCGTYLNEDGSAALNLSRGFVSNIFV
jgi:hypothetical protein